MPQEEVTQCIRIPMPSGSILIENARHIRHATEIPEASTGHYALVMFTHHSLDKGEHGKPPIIKTCQICEEDFRNRGNHK